MQYERSSLVEPEKDEVPKLETQNQNNFRKAGLSYVPKPYYEAE